MVVPTCFDRGPADHSAPPSELVAADCVMLAMENDVTTVAVPVSAVDGTFACVKLASYCVPESPVALTVRIWPFRYVPTSRPESETIVPAVKLFTAWKVTTLEAMAKEVMDAELGFDPGDR